VPSGLERQLFRSVHPSKLADSDLFRLTMVWYNAIFTQVGRVRVKNGMSSLPAVLDFAVGGLPEAVL
jgi:hypothetical protein